MDLENQATRQVYIQLLADILTKKEELLKTLLDLTKRQEILIMPDNFDEEDFLQIVSQKEEKINELTNLDDGFEKLFNSVKEELFVHKDKYEQEIILLKELIVIITDISVELQAMEKRNKIRLEAYFTRKRKEIGSSRISSKTVAKYYKTTANQPEVQSFFYDKKN